MTTASSLPANPARPTDRPRRAPPAAAASHPAAYARLAAEPQHRTGLEICRADLAEETGGPVPAPGPWSACSAAAGLTEAYLRRLDAEEPGHDPAVEAERAYLVEQFVLSHRAGHCRYAALPQALPSPWPGRPFVGGYLDPDLGLGDPDGPRGGVLLVTAPDDDGDFLARYRALNRAEAHWWSAGEDPADLARRPGLAPATRRALRALLGLLAPVRT